MSKQVNRRDFISLAAGASGAALLSSFPMPAIAQSRQKMKMILNWRYQGPMAWFFLAQDRGYFAQEGLDIVMDQGNGSGAAVGKVASGAYDLGFGDVNALIQLVAQKPEEAPLSVFQMYNRPPFTVAVLKDSPIKTAKDLAGRKLGGSVNDGALKLFPAFAEVAGIDTSKIEILNFQPSLREQMLRSKQVDGVFGYVNTIRFSAKLSGMDPDKQIRFINFGDYGMDLYSNSIIVSKALAKEKPEAVRGFLKALTKGVADTLEDMDAGIASVAKRESLINKPVEKERLIATLQDEMGDPAIAKHGLGDIDEARFKKAIDIVVKARKLPRTPAVSEVFSGNFLPPLDSRIKKLL
jgi:NitT/TauT family transport system substrate-binding protein